MRWIGEAVSTLLPAAQVGGDIVRARLVAIRGASPAIAAATVLIDVTLSIFVQVVFTLSGLALLAEATGRANLLGPAVAGSLVAMLAVGGFFAVQRSGIFRLIAALASRLARSHTWDTLVERGAAFDETVQSLYARRRALLASAVWTFCSWAVGACEVWIALLALHVPFASYKQAWILESVGQGVRSAMFLVPAALGVQEGGYLIVGGLLGIPADAALALALIRRVREVAVGVPGIIAWQWVEGRRLWRREARPLEQGPR